MCYRKLALVQKYWRDRRIFRIGRSWKTIWYKISRIDSSITSYFWIFFNIYHDSMCGHTLSGIPELFDKPRFEISSTIHDVRRYDKSIREILYHILFIVVEYIRIRKIWWSLRTWVDVCMKSHVGLAQRYKWKCVAWTGSFHPLGELALELDAFIHWASWRKMPLLAFP